MGNNIIIKALGREEEKRRQKMIHSEWSLKNVSRLTEVLEGAGETVTNHMWDLFVYNINGLRIQNGKVCYLSFYKPSKRILNMFARYNKVIIDNFDYITKR